MCIAVVKLKGIEVPTMEVLRECFVCNPDGAGLMVAKDDKVYILKGYMKWKQFKKAVKNVGITKDDAAVYHFRIATSGGIIQENCHPFPISNDMFELGTYYMETDVAMAHNGIIQIKPDKGLSDTSMFVKEMLFPMKQAILNKNEGFMNLIRLATVGSKLAFLYADGSIITTGNGWIEENGIMYSNSSFRPMYDYKSYNSYNGYGTYVYDDPRYCEACGQKLVIWGNEMYCESCDVVGYDGFTGNQLRLTM